MKAIEYKETLHGDEYGRVTDTHIYTDGHKFYIYVSDSLTIQVMINYQKGKLSVFKQDTHNGSVYQVEEVGVDHFQQIGDYNYSTKDGVKSFRQLECSFTCTIF
jgi:hypothetical protein